MTKVYDIMVGDVRDRLAAMSPKSVHCVITSPPYWGLRDYGVDGQLGLEATPQEYVEKLVEVFRQVWRVLRDDGTVWLNIGDSYASKGNGGGRGKQRTSKGSVIGPKQMPPGLKLKDLCLIPARMAIALQADGWWVRRDIIWHKPNPMPESCTDRPTTAHEYVWLLSKSPHPFYDAEAIRERGTGKSGGGWFGKQSHDTAGTGAYSRTYERRPYPTRNARSVWMIPTHSYHEAHFATFPEALPARCIKAGTSERGCCRECKAPWRRVVQVSGGTIGKSWHDHDEDLVQGQRGGTPDHKRATADGYESDYQRRTLGWRPTCEHYPCTDEWVEVPRQEDEEPEEIYAGRIAPVLVLREKLLKLWHPLDSMPCRVLDPFSGSGTTGVAACLLWRHYIGIELNPEYAAMSERRIGEAVNPNTFVGDGVDGASPLFEEPP